MNLNVNACAFCCKILQIRMPRRRPDFTISRNCRSTTTWPSSNKIGLVGSRLHLVGVANRKGYALCRWPLLASPDCHFGALVPPFRYSGRVLTPREHLGGPFWHLGSSLGDSFSLRDHPGGPWEQQDGHEVPNDRILVDDGKISGLVYVSLWWGTKCLKFVLF